MSTGATEPTKSVLTRKPINAWLLMGDAESYPSDRTLATMRSRRVSTNIWTGPSQAQPGDLLLFYFMAPRKQVRFAARAASHALPDSTIEVSSVKALEAHQWWVTHTPLVEVPPVGFTALSAAMGGHLILRGKPSHYLRPDVVAHLVEEMQRQDPGLMAAPEVERVLQIPTGDPDLPPHPATMELGDWSRMADGALRLEVKVDQYVVEPLLRLALGGRAGITWERQHQTGDGKVADWVVLSSGKPVGVVETKVGIAAPGDARWRDSRHFAQLTGYMNQLGVPGLLIDSKRMFLVDRGAASPRRELARASITATDLEVIADHLHDRHSDDTT